MKTFFFLSFLSLFGGRLLAQSTRNDIPVKDLPADVRLVLERYTGILRAASSLEECAKVVIEVAGGGLLNESGTALQGDVMPYSLKKDFESIKFYASPLQITRVNRNPATTTDGYGASAISGTAYKIWIAKAAGQPGMPAPVTIIKPSDGGTPKVVGIGSF